MSDVVVNQIESIFASPGAAEAIAPFYLVLIDQTVFAVFDRSTNAVVAYIAYLQDAAGTLTFAFEIDTENPLQSLIKARDMFAAVDHV